MPDIDVAVLGAGPAGAVAARLLGEDGLRVALVDRGAPAGGQGLETFPVSAGPLAADLGLLGPLQAIGRGRVRTARLHWRRKAETRDFGTGGPLLLPRPTLHRLLRRRAEAVAPIHSACVRRIEAIGTGWLVHTDAGTIETRMVIDARGRRGGGGDLVGLPFRLPAQGQEREMRLDALPEGWLWSVAADGTRHGTLFVDPGRLAGLDQKDRQQIVTSALSLAGARATPRPVVGRPVAAGFSAVPDPVPLRGQVLIGDAALARDPISSHGLAHALRSAVQAFAAIRTWCDPAGDPEAPEQFLRSAHARAASAAKVAVDRAYSDQARFDTPFWMARRRPSEGAAGVRTQVSGPVALAAPLTRTAVLAGNRIGWAPAIACPTGNAPIPAFGPLSAAEIAAACRPPAPLAEVAARLGRRHAAEIVSRALDRLVSDGALVQACRRV